LKQAFAITCLFAGILFDFWQWDEQMMQSPDEFTVSEFERNEYFWSVLPCAIEDQRAVVDYLTEQQDRVDGKRLAFNHDGRLETVEQMDKDSVKAAEIRFQAMRVLGLLEKMREREAGQVA
jgi:hypothetical protein